MTAEYLLKQVVIKGEAVRKAQRDYYAHKGNPREDPMKKALLQDSKSKEADFDALLVTARKRSRPSL